VVTAGSLWPTKPIKREREREREKRSCNPNNEEPVHDCVHTCLVSLQQNKRTLLWLLNCSQRERELRGPEKEAPLSTGT